VKQKTSNVLEHFSLTTEKVTARMRGRLEMSYCVPYQHRHLSAYMKETSFQKEK